MSIEHTIEIDSDLASTLSDLDYRYQEGLIPKSEMINKAIHEFYEYLVNQDGIQLIAIYKGGDVVMK